MKKLNELQSCLTRLRGLMLTLIILCSVGIGNAWGDVTDEITVGDLTATNTTYTNFSNHAETSSARYAGNTAKGNSVIQLRASNSCGIVSTTSGGVIKSVTITWNGSTVDGRVIEVYGSNTAYTGSSDLYTAATKGVLLGTISKGTTTPLEIVGDFKYIGLKSNGTNTYISKFSITWTDEEDPKDFVYNLVTDASDLSAGDRLIILNTGGTYAMSTTQNTNNRAGVAAAANNWSLSGTTVTLGASTTVEVMTVGVLNGHKILVTSTGYLRAAGNTTSYTLKTNSSTDTYCEWVITINGSNEASIVGQGDNTNKTMQFNSNLFACYGSAAYTALKIYKQEPPQYTVTWAAGSEEEFYTQTDVAGTALEDPGTPTAGTYCPGGKVFVGWTETPIVGEDDDAPADLFTSVSGMSIPEGGTTYYAVFATSSGEGSSHYEKVTSTGDITNDGKYLIVYESSSTSAIIFDGSLNPLDASPDTIMAPISTNTISATSHVKASEFTIDMTNKYIKSASNRYIYRSSYNNGMEESTTASAVTSIAISSNKFIVKGDEGTGGNSGKYTTLSYNIAAAGGSTNGSRFRFYKTPSTDIYLYKYVAGASYSAYATSCVVAYDIVLDDGEVATTNNGSAKVAADAKELTDITAPTKTGYKVAKYTTGNGSGSDIADKDGKLIASVSVSATVWTNSDKEWKKGSGATFYASWTPISYSVRFNANDAGKTGTASGSMSNQNFNYGTAQNLTTNAFSLTGYTFQGWATSAGGSVAHTDGKSVSNLSTTDGDVVDLYAVWQANTYDVTLAATSETSSVGSQVVTATYGSAMPLVTTADKTPAVAALSRTGYTFDGWEYSSTQYYSYNAGTSTLSSAHVWDIANSTTTLTPRWNVNSYTLTWDKNGGNALTGDYTSGSVNYGATITPPNTPTRSGYDFAGWDDGSGVVTPATTMPAGDVAYTATWTKKSASGWTWTYNSAAIPDPLVLYVGINKTLDITWDPSDLLSEKKNYTVTKTDSYVAQGGKGNDYYTMRGAAGVTQVTNTTVTFSLSGLSDVEVNVTVKPQPRVHFVDKIHGESFDDLLPTVVSYVATFVKATPTHSDVSDPGSNYNTCERQHLHLVGWILSTWADANPGASPSQITGAGSGKYYAAGADINVETHDGDTFYAVWSKVE